MIGNSNYTTLKIVGMFIPLLIALSIFFVRIESRLSRIETDITWIKQSMTPCPQSLEKATP